MEKVLSALREVKEINNAYEISDERVDRLLAEIPDAKVCTPIIGMFSSGKSALVNAILGYSKKKMLREDVTPETAIPAEILYSEAQDSVTIIKKDGEMESFSVDEYIRYKADAGTVKCARILLDNTHLEQFPDVMLVDMPGVESGFDVHNRAIDDYLPQSMVYLVAFPADDLIVRSSVGNILKELCLNNMPLCIVITKSDKKPADFEAAFAYFRESLPRYIGDRKVRFCMTCSRTGDVEEVEKFLAEIQEQSQHILKRKYVPLVTSVMENTGNYLKTALEGSRMTESELAVQEDQLKKRMADLSSGFQKEQINFEEEIADCVEEIKNDVQCALEGETSVLVTMALNGQSLNDRVNILLRSAVTKSVKQRLAPRMEKHFKKVSKFITDGAAGDVNVVFSFDTGSLNKGVSAAVVGVVAGILLNPIIGVIVGFITKHLQDKKREEQKQKVRMKLQNEVYPQIMREVHKSIKMEITRQVTMINQSIENEFRTQKETLEKAMSDLENQLNDEKDKRETLAAGIRADLEKIEDIKAALNMN